MARIDCWSSKLLSYAGRLQLIKSVLFGIQTYWSQVFLLPQKVIKLIQSACRAFLWTGKSGSSKRNLVAWEQICMPKTAGGWNVTSMQDWNKAAICKQLWCVAKKKDKLWVRWVNGYYVKDQNINTMTIPAQASWVVRKILEARDYIAHIPNGETFLINPCFSIRKLYLEMRGAMQRVQWHKMISRNLASPKCLFITWLAILGRLATSDRILKMGIVCDQLCCLCNRENETLNHLFFQCSFSSQIWKELADWSGVHGQVYDWEREKEIMVTQCRSKTGKQKVYRLVMATVIYHIWKERNYRRFQDNYDSVESVVRQCQLHIAIRGAKDARIAQYLKT